MTSIKLMLTGAQAWASATGPLTSGMVGIPVTIEYDETWDGLTKNLMCRCSPWGSNDGEIRTLLNVGENAVVAHEVMQPDMYLHLGVEGFSDDGKLVMPTTWARCGKIEYGANTCDDPSTDPELSVWNQLQIEMEQTKEYVLTPEQAANIQDYAQEAAQAAQESRQAAEEAKQTVESGLYYIPAVSQPTDATLKFEFTPSITGVPIPKPVTVELPVGEGTVENVDLTGYATETWVQEGYQPKGNYLTVVPVATLAVLGGVKPTIAKDETMTQPVAVDEDGSMWTVPAASGTVLVAASDAPAIIQAAAQYVCTGVNDQLMINAAIDAVREGEVRLSGGSYYLTGSIYPKSKTQIVGRNATLYMSDEIASTITQAYAAGDTVIHVADASVFVLGQKVCTDAGIAASYKCRIAAIDTAANTVTLDNPLSTAAGFEVGTYRLIVDFSAVWFDGVSDATVEGVIVEGNKDALTFYDTDYGNNGILFSNATRCKAIECTANNVLTHGFLMLYSAQCQEINCTAKDCARLGFDVFGGDGGHLIHGCVAINGDTGFQNHNAVNTIVSNCTATGANVGFSAQSGNTKNVLFVGCAAYSNRYGFKCIASGTKIISIIGCTIIDSANDGIQLDAANATELLVADNVIKNSQQRAIWLLGANGFTITGNHITDCCTADTGTAVSDKAAICIYGAAKNGLVSGNNIQLNTTDTKGCACGIAEYSLTGDNNVVVNNVIRGARVAATNKLGANSVFENNYEFAA